MNESQQDYPINIHGSASRLSDFVNPCDDHNMSPSKTNNFNYS